MRGVTQEQRAEQVDLIPRYRSRLDIGYQSSFTEPCARLAGILEIALHELIDFPSKGPSQCATSRVSLIAFTRCLTFEGTGFRSAP